MSVRVFAPAKINVTLEVGRPRSDGYHPLQSVVMFADVGDVVEATPADSLSLTISGEFSADIIADESNLVLRAAHAFAEAAKIDRPCARLVLEKNLPVASGIGGGSADAAAALRALNELWGLNWPLAQLHPIALRLGADAPVCLAGVPAYMTGVGEIFTPVSASSIAAVLANPLKPLPTPAVYRRFDAMGLGGAFTERRAPSWPDAAAACAEAAAIMNLMTWTTRDYLKTRHQFGVPLASFQALQHRAADMFVLAEQATGMAYMAAVKVASRDPAQRARAVSAAKAWIGRAGRKVGQEAIQMHGGMGMTDELPITHYFRRLTMIDTQFGDAAWHKKRFAALPAETAA